MSADSQPVIGATALAMRQVVKTYGSLRAVDAVDFEVRWGEVHALLGENGAGKSTLMNVLYGLTRPDRGEIVLDGHPLRLSGPQDAIARGIGMVHQHFMLIPPLTVAENVILGSETTGFGGSIDLPKAIGEVRGIAQAYGLEVDPAARIHDLSVGAQQRVEIIKALYRGARLLVLDEPTSVLTPQEVEGLFEVIRQLTARGAAVIFITHKLREVIEIADRITVMRRGRVVATTRPAESDEAELARMMVGRPVLLEVEKTPARPGEVVLELRGVRVEDDRHQIAVEGADLEVRAGEILGIAGVEGNGQAELVEAIVHLRPLKAGWIRLQGRDIAHRSTASILHMGLSHIPADRHRMGAILPMSIADNVVLPDYNQPPFARGIVRVLPRILEYTRQLIERFDIRTQGPELPFGSLSGGNQQKVVVARELGSSPRVLLASQPTRGVDVGSIEFIHRQIVQQRDQGLAVLLVSSELDEVLALADQVAVMYRGRIVGVFAAGAADRGRIGLLMAGVAA